VSAAEAEPPCPSAVVGRSGRAAHRDVGTRRDRRIPVLGWVGFALVLMFVIMGLGASRLAGYRVIELSGKPFRPPSLSHLLGTNLVGQDLATQLFQGARTSLFMAVAAGGGTVVVGVVVGMLAGWTGGPTDAVLLRVMDIFLVIPGLPLLVVLGAYVGPSMTGVAIIIIATAWPATARLIRAQVLSLRPRAHLRASVGFGAGTIQVLRRHVLPEVTLVAVAAFVASAGWAVMIESGLAFLGLGDPLRASWGRTIRDALNFHSLFFSGAWKWWLLPPVLCVALFLLGLTFCGIALEQRVNPRVARHAVAPGARA